MKVACEWLPWLEEHLGRGVKAGHEDRVGQGLGLAPLGLLQLELELTSKVRMVTGKQLESWGAQETREPKSRVYSLLLMGIHRT